MYPVMLDVSDRACLVVGGGGVALRKAQGLVEEGARVTVVAPEVVAPLQKMADEGRLRLELRRFSPGEATAYALVFAATDDREVNSVVYHEANDAGVWVNVADDPEICSFHLTGRVRRGPLQLAIASAGEAPFVVRRLRQVLDRRFGEEWAEWVHAASRFRDLVRELGGPVAEQEELFDRFFSETVDEQKWRTRVPTAAEVESWLSAAGAETGDSKPVATGGCQEGAAGSGFVSLVGAGPGCAGLLTQRGRQRLAEADAVVYDRLAAPALPCDLDFETELHPVGKEAGRHPMPQEEINALLVRLASSGLRVVRLKGGDPYVFGRGGEEAEVLAAAGIGFEVVPGVTSGVAAMAWAGIPVTHRREAVRLTLLTAHEAVKSDGPQVRWDLLAQDRHATIVGYMGVTALPEVVHQLLGSGMDPATPAAMVEQGTTSAQRKVVSTLKELPSAVVDGGLKPPALFVIGPTVKHAETLDWFSRMPLAGERLVVPDTARVALRKLEEAGAGVVPLPYPVPPAARVVMAALPITGCVVTSPDEVDWVHDERGGPGWPADLVSWCVGSETSARARARGWRNVRELSGGLDCDELVLGIAGEKR
ncbi:MAG: siroheme synthase CysG [Thermoanaerobaculales bacterium]|jgi:uroporphyrin-III C-methyltransferase/precorrin-2 dehydrogenase/sirohydrochlorin ferrochelatase|nr:siroheme synthase CysG [Thermoanaerobaculales bacterium]